MRALVDTAQGRISKELLLRIAEDYERFAQSIEDRPDRFVPSPETAPVDQTVPTEVQQYGQRTTSRVAAPSLVPEEDILEIPSFLRQRSTSGDEPSDDNER
jgi:hypothetical protein